MKQLDLSWVSFVVIPYSGSQVSSGHSSCRKSEQTSSNPLSRQISLATFPCEPKVGKSQPCIICGPCPVHLLLLHQWGDCDNNPRNKSVDCVHSNGPENSEWSGWGSYYSSCGGPGCRHNTLCNFTPFPTLFTSNKLHLLLFYLMPFLK